MIIVRLQGGLGNQLFQYAAGKALAHRLNKPFKLETITSLQKDKKRSIALQGLQGDFALASPKEVKEFLTFPSLYRHNTAFFSRFGRNIYKEPHFHFDKNFSCLKDPVFLDGFWQSPFYFQDIESTIRKDFTVKPELVSKVLEKGKELEQRSSVAVHVRRGDFTNKAATSYHGILSAFYYEKAIGLIKEKDPSACIYFFSDDIEWVKQNLAVDKNVQFISSFENSAIEDFYLMTKCRHNIVANSSFSWWPAWLNSNPDKMVIAPKKWFVDTTINTNDLIPPEWRRL
jgi:hypothetical protein